MNRVIRRAAVLLCGGALAACGTAPPPSPAPAPVATPVEARPSDASGVNAGSVAFMRGMIAHHAQAVAMTELVPTRTASDDLRLVAERIAVSQRDEMARMRRWLRARGQSVPDSAVEGMTHAGMDPSSMDHSVMHAGAMTSGAMPGMLTPEEMAQLRAASGAEFDRLFVQGMIRHHQGALAMVAQLFSTPGATQDTELFQFASDVDADQRAEISRLRQLRVEPGTAPAPR